MISLITVLVIGSSYIGDVCAYEFPANAFYIKFIDQTLGEVTLYVPSNQVAYLSLEENNQIINTSSSNITCYSNDIDFTVSFQPYQYGRYRQTNYNDYSYLNITEIIDFNLPISNDSTFWLSSNSDLVSVSVLIIGGALLLLIWLKL